MRIWLGSSSVIIVTEYDYAYPRNRRLTDVQSTDRAFPLSASTSHSDTGQLQNCLANHQRVCWSQCNIRRFSKILIRLHLYFDALIASHLVKLSVMSYVVKLSEETKFILATIYVHQRVPCNDLEMFLTNWLLHYKDVVVHLRLEGEFGNNNHSLRAKSEEYGECLASSY